METKSDPQSGINAWLEEELQQQYRHDRTSVDPEWKTIFDREDQNGGIVPAGNGHGKGNGASHAQTPATAVMLRAPEPVLSGSEELMPLRGAPARIAENMAISATIPLA